MNVNLFLTVAFGQLLSGLLRNPEHVVALRAG
jgi:hypothetical protein